ncbi:MAG TPA: universal stress protein, partial [Bacteroidia bacterium]|nr:universal stress protein [Bacteroidia bacterium]
LDFSDISLEAIKHACLILKYTSGEIILLHVHKKRDVLDFIAPENEVSDVLVTNFVSKKLEELAEKIRKENNLIVSARVSVGNITGEIMKIVELDDISLIIMGTRGRDTDNNRFIGSNAYRVITKSKIPVIAVHSSYAKPAYENILIPIDTSEHSRQKVDSAIYLAKKLNSQLSVIGLIGKGEETYTYKMEVIMGQIQKLAKDKNVNCVTEIQTSVNRAVSTLTYCETINADLIIIMTDQHAEFSSIILGTYAHQLINESKVPVLCIPPETHPENIPPDNLGGMW